MRKYYVIFDTAADMDDGLVRGGARAVFETEGPMDFEKILELEEQQASIGKFSTCRVRHFYPLEKDSY